MNSRDDRGRVISRRVREARKEAGYSQTDMGERLGLTETGYGHYERGRQPFTVEQLMQISRILARPLGWFLDLPSTLSNDEERILALYRQAREEGLGQMALRTLEAIVRQD